MTNLLNNNSNVKNDIEVINKLNATLVNEKKKNNRKSKSTSNVAAVSQATQTSKDVDEEFWDDLDKQEGVAPPITDTENDKNQVDSIPSDTPSTVDDAKSKKTDSKPEDNQEEKKDKSSIDFKYITRKKADGTTYMADYRKDGDKVYKWTGEFWKFQEPNYLKKEINTWILVNFPSEYFARNLNSVYAMFTSAIKPFTTLKVEGIIIPTKIHWLKIDEKTGEITAIMPQKWQPIKYQVDIIIHHEGSYVVPANPIKDSLFENFLNTSLPRKSDPEAPYCEQVKQTLGNAKGQPSKQDLLSEYSGVSLTSVVKTQKILMNIGKGGDGKGVYQAIMTPIHGNVVPIDFADMDKYNAHLLDATLIVASEVGKGKYNSEFLKAAVSGDLVEVRAIYGEKKQGIITGKFLLSANNYPRIDDFSDGLFRRLMIIEWDNQFDDESRDVDLVKKIIKSELKLVLDWCLMGLQRVINNKWKFSEVEDSKRALNNLKSTSDKVRMFVEDMEMTFDGDKKQITIKEEIFKAYNKWANDNCFEEMNTTAFWTRLGNIFPKLKEDPNLKKHSKRAVYLTGPKFKSTIPNFGN